MSCGKGTGRLRHAPTRLSVAATRAAMLLACACGLAAAGPARAAECVGDCDGSGSVAVNELVTMVNVALGGSAACPQGIPGGATVDIALIVRAVSNALGGCAGASATPTPAAPTAPPTQTPTAGSFTAIAARLRTRRAGHTATWLPAGGVLVTGGDLRAPGAGTTNRTAEWYDPATGRFTALAAVLMTAREGHAATLLSNGTVLLTGGFNDQSEDLDTAEIYDPESDRFVALGARMTTPRTNHTATLLANGTVLIAGGAYHSGSAVDSAELFNPDTNTFAPLAATMHSRRQAHTATRLASGEVLLTGGVDGCCGGDDLGTNLDTAEVYDPAAGTFAALTARLASPRFFHAASALADGRVLLTGGLAGQSFDEYRILDTAELYDPTSGTFTAVSAMMTTARAGHTATLLPGGIVLVIGGVNEIAGAALSTAEQYGP